MRVVGGRLAGRTFEGPPGKGTRPTADRVREAIASAVAARTDFEGARALDLFAGTGAFAFEALSRGASCAVSVERDPRTLRVLSASARALGLEGRVRALALDLSRPGVEARLAALDEAPFDLVFADPPWAEAAPLPALLGALARAGALSPRALVVAIFGARDPLADPPGLEALARYRYGDTGVVLYALAAGEAPSSPEAEPEDPPR